MTKNTIYITLIVFIFIIVILCRWQNIATGLLAESSNSGDTLSDTSADSAVTLPVIQQSFSSLEYLDIDTEKIYSSSNIAYSDFIAPYFDTVYRDIKHVILSEDCISIGEDSLEYFHRSQMISPKSPGHDSPFSIDIFIEKSAFKVQDNMIRVRGYRIQILNDHQLRVLDLPKIHSGTILYCNRRFYDHKKLKFWGDWKDGKQNGVWFYIDPHGKTTQVTYDMGNPVEQVINPPLDHIKKHILSLPWPGLMPK